MSASRIVAIDPGCTDSAWLCYHEGRIEGFGKTENENVRRYLRGAGVDHLAIEMIASYGMPVGKEVFETCVWIGRFIEAWGKPYSFVYRKDVKLHLCGTVRAKDANIRAALIDRFGAPGTKGKPGQTYGISKDVWSALAVAVTHMDKELVTA